MEIFTSTETKVHELSRGINIELVEVRVGNIWFFSPSVWELFPPLESYSPGTPQGLSQRMRERGTAFCIAFFYIHALVFRLSKGNSSLQYHLLWTTQFI